MEKEKLNIPIHAINPLFGILYFEWFVFLLKNTLRATDKGVNVWIIHDSDYSKNRKELSPFLAKMKKKSLVDALYGIKEIVFVSDYDANKLIVVAHNDITQKIQDTFELKEIHVTMGATASVENDSEFTIIDRALKAIGLAQAKNINFQIL